MLVQSFGPDVLKAVHAVRPELPLVQLLPDAGTPIDPAMLDSVSEYAIAIGPESTSVDATLVGPPTSAASTSTPTRSTTPPR